jgi:hypothetical protein
MRVIQNRAPATNKPEAGRIHGQLSPKRRIGAKSCAAFFRAPPQGGNRIAAAAT